MIHDTDMYVISVHIVEISEDPLGVPRLSRQQKMTYDDTLSHQAGFRVKLRAAHLTEHFSYGFSCFLEIVCSPRIFYG